MIDNFLVQFIVKKKKFKGLKNNELLEIININYAFDY